MRLSESGCTEGRNRQWSCSQRCVARSRRRRPKPQQKTSRAPDLSRQLVSITLKAPTTARSHLHSLCCSQTLNARRRNQGVNSSLSPYLLQLASPLDAFPRPPPPPPPPTHLPSVLPFPPGLHRPDVNLLHPPASNTIRLSVYPSTLDGCMPARPPCQDKALCCCACGRSTSKRTTLQRARLKTPRDWSLPRQ